MKKYIDGVPIIEYFDETLNNYKGIVFLIHGHTGCKELKGLESIVEGFVQRGCFLVSLDAYKHGERILEPYVTKDYIEKTIAMPEVILHTIDDLVNLYRNYYKEISTHVTVIGISMGGHIAFQIPKYMPEVSVIIPLIGSPDIVNHYKVTKRDFLKERISECIDNVNRLEITDTSSYMSVKIGAFNGDLDQIVDSKFVVMFINRMIALKHHQIYYESFKSGHTVTEEMVIAMFRFFDKIVQ